MPDGLQQIVNWMMAKDPAGRYPTPERAAQALQVFLAAGAPNRWPLRNPTRRCGRTSPGWKWRAGKAPAVPAALADGADALPAPMPPGSPARRPSPPPPAGAAPAATPKPARPPGEADKHKHACR